MIIVKAEMLQNKMFHLKVTEHHEIYSIELKSFVVSVNLSTQVAANGCAIKLKDVIYVLLNYINLKY